MKNLKRILLPLALFLLVLNVPVKAADGYHNHQDLTQAIKNLVASNPQIAKVQSIGKTAQGRDLWMIQISGTKGGTPEEKQALLIAGNLEGDHLIGSEVALGIADYLIKGYGKEEIVTDMLDRRTFYIAPRLNPDGAEAFFAEKKHEQTANLKPRDDDYDWQVDEDGPEDLNGDGLITQMRIKDKDGDWCIDENDPRLMRRKESDTPLDKLYKVYTEGLDDDGDGLYNEDGPGGFNINRNFPHNFGYNPKGIGVYAVSEAETAALIDFMLKYDPEFKGQPHRNICGVLLFSKYDNLAAGTGIECGTPTFPEPPQAEEAPARGMMMFRMGRRGGAPTTPEPRPTDPQPKRTESRDENLFKTVSDQYKAITDITSAVSERPFGSLLEWAYFQFGVPSFSANLWSLRQAAPSRSPMRQQVQADAPQRGAQSGQMQMTDRNAMMQRFSSMRPGGASQPASSGYEEQWLKWIDDSNEGKGFVAWMKFSHKQLGEVEIGGFEPYLKVNPPAAQIPGLSQSHGEFALYLASQFAEITMDEPVVEKLSSNLFRLTVKVHNTGKFPYVTAMGTRTRNISPIVLLLKLQEDEDMELFGGANRNDISNLDAGAERDFNWTIISPPGKEIDVSLWARNGGGTVKKKVVLK